MASARKKDLPTPLAATGTTTLNREVLGDEYVRDLQDQSNRMRIYTRMRRGDGAINTSLLAIEKPILGGRWEVAGDDPIAEACRDELFSADRGAHFDPPLLEQAVECLLGMFQYGFAACEPFWEIGEDGKVHCSSLTLIRQESVRTFRLDENARLTDLVQYTRALDAGFREISVPVDQLLMAVHGREGSDYSGVAIIRSSYRSFIERDTIRKTRLWHHDRFGAGTPVATYPDGATDDQKNQIDDALASFRAGSTNYLALPFGSEITLVGGQTGYDPTSELSALASEIAKNTLSQLTELGTSGNTGNRSLGDSFAEVLRNALQGYAERIGSIIRRQLMTPFVKWNFGDTAEVPELTVRVSLGGVAELLSAITMAVGAGLKLEPEDIASLRDELELPDIPLEDLKARIAQRQVDATRSQLTTPAKDQPPKDAKPNLSIVASEGARQYSSTQFNLPEKAAAIVKEMAAKIPDADLADEGREDNPHITVKYGLHTDNPNELRPILADEYPPLRATLGKTTFFSTATADVVVVLVDSYEIKWLNERISAALPHTDTHAEYIPHITLAYVKPGMGGKYVDDTTLVGRMIEFSALVFSSKDNKETTLPLGKKFTLAEPMPMQQYASDYIGRMRPAKIVQMENDFVKPKLLSELLDREAVRATADVHDVLREIDASLVAQVKDLAERGAGVLVEKIGSVSVPTKLATKLKKALATAADRANTIGRDSVRSELERQGLTLQSVPNTRRTSLMERVLASLTLADADLYGGLAAFLKMLIDIATEQETSARELGARNAAIAAISAEATAGAIDYIALAKRVQSDLEDRSIGAVENRVTQVLNVSFGHGRVETGKLFGQDIEKQIRTAVLDANTCQWCASQDGTEYDQGDPAAPDLPDPDCEGRWNCRCFYFYELAKAVA